MVENFDVKNSDNPLVQLPDKNDMQAIYYTFLTKWKDIFKKQQAKLFDLYAACGLFLEQYFKEFKNRGENMLKTILVFLKAMQETIVQWET